MSDKKREDIIVAISAGVFLGGIVIMANNNPLNAINTMNQLTEGIINTANDGQNNPGNIRVSNNAWDGKIPPVAGQQFERFTQLWYGYRAMLLNLQSYINQGANTLEKIIPMWAPGSDNNNDAAYIAYVSEETGLDPNNDVISADDSATLDKIITAMTHYEQGKSFQVNPADIAQATANA